MDMWDFPLNKIYKKTHLYKRNYRKLKITKIITEYINNNQNIPEKILKKGMNRHDSFFSTSVSHIAVIEYLKSHASTLFIDFLLFHDFSFRDSNFILFLQSIKSIKTFKLVYQLLQDSLKSNKNPIGINDNNVYFMALDDDFFSLMLELILKNEINEYLDIFKKCMIGNRLITIDNDNTFKILSKNIKILKIIDKELYGQSTYTAIFLSIANLVKKRKITYLEIKNMFIYKDIVDFIYKLIKYKQQIIEKFIRILLLKKKLKIISSIGFMKKCFPYDITQEIIKLL